MNAYCERLAFQIGNELGTLREPRSSAFLRLWGKVREDFCTAPASGRSAYHHCWRGGLAEHSLGVLAYARRLASALLPEPTLDADEAVTIAALLHDLGKSGGFYRPLAADDPRRAKGEHYSYDKTWTHAQRSLYLLQNEGIVLTSEEYRAILLHDGQYIEGNRGYSMAEPDLAIVVHWADLWNARHAPPKPDDAEV